MQVVKYIEHININVEYYFGEKETYKYWWTLEVSKVGELSRGWPAGSLFNSYHAEVLERVLLHFLDCSNLPLIITL